MSEDEATMDGNEAVASVAHRTNQVIAVYPITPASPMGELADVWTVARKENIWGCVPTINEMQSEGGAAGAVHGSLQAGALTTTFTSSQGLLLMLPNMYKIAGELNAFCMHVAARSVATHALSIFCDHSDVMAARATGFAILASCSVQEAQDLACIGQAATLRSRVPFVHFFDGFRTSHEISKIKVLTDDDLRFMIDDDLVREHRHRALTPDRPVIRGTAQNPDVFFQSREAPNRLYELCVEIVEREMVRFAERTGRRYRPFEYFGHPRAERVVVLMGSAVETAAETAKWLIDEGERVGVVNVRLYRPFSAARLIACLPESTRAIAVLDRTKEPGSAGEPLLLDVVSAIREASEDRGAFLETRVIGGRYGLGSKEFTPAMVKSVFQELCRSDSKRRFSVGIADDVTYQSLPVDPTFDIEGEDTVRAVFYGLGSDGTVGANKNSIKIIGEETDLFAQGYFVYDSRKAGAVTVSHLRFGKRPIRAPYLIRSAGFVACHQFGFLDRYDVLELASPGAKFLLDAPHPPEELWDRLPREVQDSIREKRLEFYAIDARRLAAEAGLGVRTNTIMQTCFFALMEILPREVALAKIKESVEKTYARRGRIVVERNFEVIDRTLENLHRIEPSGGGGSVSRKPVISEEAPGFLQRVTAMMLTGKGDQLPVSVFPVDGTWPVGSGRWEKRNLAPEIPIWDPEVCIQCNRCAFACPHAAIRAKVYDPAELAAAPEGFRSKPYRGFGLRGQAYTIQVAPEDCTGCNLCVNVCPAKDKSNSRRKAINMQPQPPIREQERENYRFFLELPEVDRREIRHLDLRGAQLFEPLFEYSSACPGCGETPYIKLLTQLFGDRSLIANATGCSSIYGGNLPTTPYSPNRHGRGPAWSNSLFEDNAEFGFGMRLAVNALEQRAVRLLHELASSLGDDLVTALLHPDSHSESGIQAQRERVSELRRKLAGLSLPNAERLAEVADYLVRKSIWLVGGDGWAYDIGYGGLDHVLAQEEDVNVLVLDTEVYSNTGGQQSKATPLGAAAKFAMAGKSIPKKDLGMEAMSYGHVYVARIAFGADPNQTTRAFIEADSYPGPSLIIAMSPCIAHGYDLRFGAEQQTRAVQSGAWPLYRFDPRRVEEGEPPLRLDSKEPKMPIEEYMLNETRFRMVHRMQPERFRSLAASAQRHAARRFWVYERMAEVTLPDGAIREKKLPEKHQIAGIGSRGK